jgi:hypothetical protein
MSYRDQTWCTHCGCPLVLGQRGAIAGRPYCLQCWSHFQGQINADLAAKQAVASLATVAKWGILGVLGWLALPVIGGVLFLIFAVLSNLFK